MTTNQKQEVTEELLEIPEVHLDLKELIAVLWKKGFEIRKGIREIKQEGAEPQIMNMAIHYLTQKAKSFSDEIEKKVNFDLDSSTSSTENPVRIIKSSVEKLINEFESYLEEIISTEFSKLDDNLSGEREHSSACFTREINELEKLVREKFSVQSSQVSDDELTREARKEVQNLEEEIKRMRKLTWWQGNSFFPMLFVCSLLVNFYLLFRYLVRKLKVREKI